MNREITKKRLDTQECLFVVWYTSRVEIFHSHKLFLNLPFLANFYKLTGMSQTYEVLTNLSICNLFFVNTV